MFYRQHNDSGKNVYFTRIPKTAELKRDWTTQRNSNVHLSLFWKH